MSKIFDASNIYSYFLSLGNPGNNRVVAGKKEISFPCKNKFSLIELTGNICRSRSKG